MRRRFYNGGPSMVRSAQLSLHEFANDMRGVCMHLNTVDFRAGGRDVTRALCQQETARKDMRAHSAMRQEAAITLECTRGSRS